MDKKEIQVDKKIRDSVEIVGDYLARFYHEEPSDVVASTKAVKSLTGMFDSEREISNAFLIILSAQLPNNLLKEIIQNKANRYVRNDDEARTFLEKIYYENSLDCVIDTDDEDS